MVCRSSRAALLALALVLAGRESAEQALRLDQASSVAPLRTEHLVRNLSVALSDPLELKLAWNPAVNTTYLGYYVLSVLHVSADGLEKEYENVLNASLTSIYLRDEWVDEMGDVLRLDAGVRLAFRMRAVYWQGSTKVLAGRVRAQPAQIVVLDKAGSSQLLRPCAWVSDTGACGRFSYSCASQAASTATAGTGNCSTLGNHSPLCTYVQPFSASFSWSAPVDVIGESYSVLRYHLQLYDSLTSDRIREVTIAPISTKTAVRFTNLEAWEGRLLALRVRAETIFENEVGSANGSWSNLSAGILVPGLLLPPDIHAASGGEAGGQGYLNVDLSVAPGVVIPEYLALLRFDVQVSATPDFQTACELLPGTPLQPFFVGNTSLSTRFHNLSVGQTYYIRARTITYTGPGNFSADAVAKTVVTPPSVPVNLSYQCVAALAFNVTWRVPDNIGCGSGASCSLTSAEVQSAVVYHLAILPILVSGGSAPQLDSMSNFEVATRATSYLFDNLTKGRRYWVYSRSYSCRVCFRVS